MWDILDITKKIDHSGLASLIRFPANLVPHIGRAQTGSALLDLIIGYTHVHGDEVDGLVGYFDATQADTTELGKWNMTTLCNRYPQVNYIGVTKKNFIFKVHELQQIYISNNPCTWLTHPAQAWLQGHSNILPSSIYGLSRCFLSCPCFQLGIYSLWAMYYSCWGDQPFQGLSPGALWSSGAWPQTLHLVGSHPTMKSSQLGHVVQPDLTPSPLGGGGGGRVRRICIGTPCVSRVWRQYFLRQRGSSPRYSGHGHSLQASIV